MKETSRRRASHRRRKESSTRMLRGRVKTSWRIIVVGIFARLHRRRLLFHREVSVFTEGEREGMSREGYISSAEETWYISF